MSLCLVCQKCVALNQQKCKVQIDNSSMIFNIQLEQNMDFYSKDVLLSMGVLGEINIGKSSQSMDNWKNAGCK